jgi:hypothetical protein
VARKDNTLFNEDINIIIVLNILIYNFESLFIATTTATTTTTTTKIIYLFLGVVSAASIGTL